MTHSGHRPMRRRLYAVRAAVVWICGPLAYLVLEAVAAAAFRQHYRYGHNFISDLGVPSRDSPLALLMNIGFCLQGILFFAGAILIVRAFEPRKARLFLTLAAENAVGNILIAAFHSGPAAQADGTARVHAIGALLAIVGGNAAIVAGTSIIRDVRGPRWYRGGIGRARGARPAQLRDVCRRDGRARSASAARSVGAMQRLFDRRVANVHRHLAAGSRSLTAFGTVAIRTARAFRISYNANQPTPWRH